MLPPEFIDCDEWIEIKYYLATFKRLSLVSVVFFIFRYGWRNMDFSKNRFFYLCDIERQYVMI